MGRISVISILVMMLCGLGACVHQAKDTPSLSHYDRQVDAGFALQKVPTHKLDGRLLRQRVPYQTSHIPGTIIVETKENFLYLVEPDGMAMRYGIGVGREGFSWSGTATIARKKEWPRWTPPPEMIKRQPELEKYRKGMEPGLLNPLGARALYLHNKQGDTGYRLHGTPEWWSIGRSLSSGCIRLLNQDIIDLYDRAEVGAKVIVR